MHRGRKKLDSLVEQSELLGAADVKIAGRRLAEAIVERNREREKLVLIGIRTGGALLANRLQRSIAEVTNVEVPVGTMDITLYRDDVFVGLPRPQMGPTEVPFALDGRVVILVDDVLFTGRTIRSALVELMEFGRPAAVQLAVLVDRGHRELPIAADYVALKVETSRAQSVCVMLSELGEPDRVVLLGRIQA